MEYGILRDIDIELYEKYLVSYVEVTSPKVYTVHFEFHFERHKLGF